MKKLLSVALLLMLVTLCFALASCNKVDTDEVNNNPVAAMSNAAENTVSEFFSEGNVYETIRKTLDKGSVTIVFDNEKACEEFSSRLGDFDATFYFDRELGKYAVNLSALYNGEDEDKEDRELLKLSAYLDKDNIVIKDEGLLNVNDSYKLNITNLINNFPDTNLGEALLTAMFNDDTDVYDEYKDMVLKAKAEFDKILVDTEISEDFFLNTFLKAFATASTEEEIEINGETYKCVVANYSVTKENVEKAIKETLKAVGTQYGLNDTIDQYEEQIEAFYDELDEANDFEATVKVFFDKGTGAIVSTVVDGKYAYTSLEWVEGNNPGYDDFYNSNYDAAYYAYYEDHSSEYYSYPSLDAVIIDMYEKSTGRKYEESDYKEVEQEQIFEVAYNTAPTEFSSTITLTDADGDTESNYSGVKKAKDGNVTTYTFTVTESDGFEVRVRAKAVLSYDKSTGKVVASILDEKTNEVEYSLNATVAEENGGVKITLDTITRKNYIEYTVNASVIFTPDVEVPVITGDNDVAEFDADDIKDMEKMGEDFYDSAFRYLWRKLF